MTWNSVQIDRIHRRLFGYYDAPEANQWMESPHPMLNGEKPIDLINSGRALEVDRILDQLDAGVYL